MGEQDLTASFIDERVQPLDKVSQKWYYEIPEVTLAFLMPVGPWWDQNIIRMARTIVFVKIEEIHHRQNVRFLESPVSGAFL